MIYCIRKIDKAKILSYNESFKIASYCSTLLSGNDKKIAKARKIVIHVLNNWGSIPSETYPIWTDIIEAVGFYPYIEKNKETMIIRSLSDEVRQKSHLSKYLSSTYLHKEQKILSDILLSKKNVIASAPTSFGKSLLIEELVASGKYHNIVIIQPTLALLDETRLKLKKYSTNFKIIVRTTQPAATDKGNLFLLTAERVMEYNQLPKIDLLIIDEFYKLSLKRLDERADTLNNAFLKIVGMHDSKFYFLGPNVDGITDGFAKKYNAIFYKSNYSLVDCDIFDMTIHINQSKIGASLDDKKSKQLCDLLDKLKNEQTLIYCSTPVRARRFAKKYLEHLISNGAVANEPLPLIDWIKENISERWSLIDELSYGIAIHDGSIQKHIGASIIKYFNDGLLHYIFCTSTIIEGVNTNAKNVILFDGNKGRNNIDFFDYSNIKGRSGRFMEHYVGRIFNFVKPPIKETVIIDIPFFEQDLVSDEILINIPANDIKEAVKPRYEELNKIPAKLLEIVKRNGVSINGQMGIYNQLEHDISTSKYTNFAWSQMPDWDKILYILNISENKLFQIDHHGISSVKQLALYLYEYKKSKNIISIVDKIYTNKISNVKRKTAQKNADKYYDEAIEQAFHIYRHWFLFTIPKIFRVVDSLQRYVCECHEKQAGSYSYFVQQLENDFIPENLSILTEFGLPTSAIRKLESKIPNGLSEDDIIEYIQKHKQWLTSNWLEYEKDKLLQCL
jgi:hypothetical protein